MDIILLRNCYLSNYKIDIIDNFSKGSFDSELKILSKNENIELLNIDLLDNNVLNEIGDDYSYIYHLAAVIGVRHVMRSPYDVLDKNVLLLKNALIIAQKQKKIKRFCLYK